MRKMNPARKWPISILVLIGFLLNPGSASYAQQKGKEVKQNIGRMIMVGFRGLSIEPDDPIARQIRKGYVGGVILYTEDVPSDRNQRNIQSLSQVKQLVAQLQSLSDRNLLIAIDQEGGEVQRLSPEHGVYRIPSHQKLGERDDPEYTYEVAEKMATTLTEVGINVNFAPVVDLNLNPDNPVIGGMKRSFGANPETVTRHARQFIRAHREHQVVPVLKHFPGHGSSRKDSHKGFVDVTDTWKPKELIPFRTLIGGDVIPSVMTAHIYNEYWDMKWPATLSTNVIQTYLRDRLGHQGLVLCQN